VRGMTLPESHLHILLVLAESDAHGYRIMQQAEEITEGAIKLRPGVLYAALGRLVDAALIVETEDRPVAELDDQRRRYYRITPEGRDALGAEIVRLSQLVERAGSLDSSWRMA
jgi:DNA-binding PadR family transcriptional regulator